MFICAHPWPKIAPHAVRMRATTGSAGDVIPPAAKQRQQVARGQIGELQRANHNLTSDTVAQMLCTSEITYKEEQVSLSVDATV